MAIIKALCSNGFKIDSLKNDWTYVDRLLQNEPVFKSLKKGFEIQIIGRDNKGVVTEFKILNTLGVEKNIELNIPIIKPEDKKQLKNQCLNIIFHNMSQNKVDLGHDGNREKGIRLAHRLFLELEDAKYYEW